MDKRFAKLKKLLKAAYPQYRVYVHRRELKKLYGQCWKSGEVYHINIDSRLKESLACETLCHEFAHVPAWPEYDAGIDHGPMWGDHYAKCYTIWIDNFSGK